MKMNTFALALTHLQLTNMSVTSVSVKSIVYMENGTKINKPIDDHRQYAKPTSLAAGKWRGKS